MICITKSFHRVLSISKYCDLDLGDMTFGKGHDTSLGHGQQLYEVSLRSKFSVKNYGQNMDFGYTMYMHCDLDLGVMILSRNDDTLFSHRQWFEILLKRLVSKELWAGHGFWLCVHCDLDLGDMTLDQGHDTPLGHGRQLCEILFKSNKVITRHG